LSDVVFVPVAVIYGRAASRLPRWRVPCPRRVKVRRVNRFLAALASEETGRLPGGRKEPPRKERSSSDGMRTARPGTSGLNARALLWFRETRAIVAGSLASGVTNNLNVIWNFPLPLPFRSRTPGQISPPAGTATRRPGFVPAFLHFGGAAIGVGSFRALRARSDRESPLLHLLSQCSVTRSFRDFPLWNYFANGRL
jgi:hypothetical protein